MRRSCRHPHAPGMQPGKVAGLLQILFSFHSTPPTTHGIMPLWEEGAVWEAVFLEVESSFLVPRSGGHYHATHAIKSAARDG